jgi:hypothetical protein
MSEQQSSGEVEYREIPGWPAYRAGSDGTVWSRWKQTANGGRGGGFTLTVGESWKKLNPRKELNRGEGNRYRGVTLTNGRHARRHVRVHKLVMEVFAGECPDGMEVRHLDGNPDNNRLDNLKYGTKSENALDAKRHGRSGGAKGESHPTHKLTDELVRAMRADHIPGKHGHGAGALARKYGIGKTVASLVISGQRWKHVK